MITDAGLNLIAQALRDGTSIEIKYVALGAGNTPPSPSDTKLEDERFRKPVSRQLPLGTGGTQTIAYIAPHEANDFVIQEIGVFAGPDATDEPNTGVLIARALYSRQKTPLESLQITRDDVFGRGN